MGRAPSVLLVQTNHQDGDKAQILWRREPWRGKCSVIQVGNYLQVLPPTPALTPGGRDKFGPQILIQLEPSRVSFPWGSK